MERGSGNEMKRGPAMGMEPPVELSTGGAQLSRQQTVDGGYIERGWGNKQKLIYFGRVSCLFAVTSRQSINPNILSW